MISEERIIELWKRWEVSDSKTIKDFARAVEAEALEAVMATIGGCECPCCLAIRALKKTGAD